MTNQSFAAGEDARALLAGTRDLARRVRLAQRGAWFPLLVMAAITFAAIPFGRYGGVTRACVTGRDGLVEVCRVYSPLLLAYWAVALLVAYATIAWFYVRRSRRVGVGTRVTPYVVVGVILAVVVTAVSFWADHHLVFQAAILGVQLRPGSPAVLYRLTGPAGAIGLAVLVLARTERSWVLLGVAAVYLAVVLIPLNFGWTLATHPSPWAFLPRVVIDGTVLLVGGIVVALAQVLARRGGS